MDLSPLTDGAVTLASAGIAALSPVLAVKLSGFLKLNLDQTHRSAVASALETALGLGLQLAKEAGDAHLANVNVKSAALAAMVGYVKQTVPDAVSHFGLTDDAIAQKAASRLTTTLHTATAASATVTALAALLPAATVQAQASPSLASP
ncbi:hypothetical protein ACELLULO517_09315 [Acidisoma cellulosilytica]|uniref:Uncharacterized protein n=1 Tax=Acidisoma cellulosilyticum TaxID=2802395 RepID=A0A963Z0G0_9PROT|nr:hypothetical protein [Acidisoma cellulosilyticum]MCB8880429.1 hypothetical protein [Acidisoma cellulosilyticum]